MKEHDSKKVRSVLARAYAGLRGLAQALDDIGETLWQGCLPAPARQVVVARAQGRKKSGSRE